jgi:hypothetical protein
MLYLFFDCIGSDARADLKPMRGKPGHTLGTILNTKVFEISPEVLQPTAASIAPVSMNVRRFTEDLRRA